MRNSLVNAAELRLRISDDWCPVKKRTNEHNNIETTHWFRRYAVCSTCGYVERLR